MQELSQVFISYSHKDQNFAIYLTACLANCSVPYWRDREKILGGDDWRNRIREAIDDCSILLLVISPDAINSPYVKFEWEYAVQTQKYVIPLILKETQLSEQLHRLHFINNFKFEGGFNNGFGELIKCLVDRGLKISPINQWYPLRHSIGDKQVFLYALLADNLVGLLQDLKHQINEIFPHTSSLVFTFPPIKFRSLIDLIRLPIEHNGILDGVISALRNLDNFTAGLYLPGFLWDDHMHFSFFHRYYRLESAKWIKTVQVSPVEKPFLYSLLPADNILLDELIELAKKMRDQLALLEKQPIVGTPLLANLVHEKFHEAKITVKSMYYGNKIPDDLDLYSSIVKVHCGYFVINWYKEPSTNKQKQALRIIKRMINDEFWYLTSFGVFSYDPNDAFV